MANHVTTLPASLSDSKRALLERYSRGDSARPGKETRTITRRSQNEPARLSLAQEQLWYRVQAEGTPPLYNESITIRYNGPLDLAALEKSLAEIIRRHEIWRTTYDTSQGVPLQVIHKAPQAFLLPVVDLRRFSEEKIETEALRLATEEARRPFDLARGPLLRGMLLRMEEAEYRLCMTAHLSILDGVSVYQVLPSELSALYQAFSAGKPSPLPELRIQYSDYACWQREWLTGDELEKQLTYWRGQLSGDLPVLDWPRAHRRPAIQTYRGAMEWFTLSDHLTDALTHLSRDQGTTLFTILVGCFSSLLHCYTRQVDLIIGTPSPAGRKRSEVQPLLGYFLNPVPLRVDLSNDPAFCDLLRRVMRVIAGAISHDDVPLECLAKELHLRPDFSCNPFFTIAISLQPETAEIGTDWEVTSMDADSGGAPWDLYLVFIKRSTGMVGRVQYNPDIFESAIVCQMLRDLQSLMQAVSANPGQRISLLLDYVN